MTFLLDANVLIALTTAEHLHHERTERWAERVDRFAVCATVEGAWMRFAVRLGARPEDGKKLLVALRSRPGFEFWHESISYVDVDTRHIQGHRQVTDAYLAGLARSRGAVLATLDQGLAEDCPDSTFLVPA